MTCSGCSSHIEKDMNAKEGVLSSAVNHETGIGEFIIDTNKMDREKLIDAVNNIGDYSVINEAEKKITVVSNLNPKWQVLGHYCSVSSQHIDRTLTLLRYRPKQVE